MELINGKTYRLESRADRTRSLNVYGTSPKVKANVCLYKSDNNDVCQQWLYTENGNDKYFVCKGALYTGLALYTGSNTTDKITNYNAIIEDMSVKAFPIVAVSTSDYNTSYVQIRLANYSDKYLTANQGSNGTANGKDVNAKGNVYWYKGGLTDYSQDWKPILIENEEKPTPPTPDALTHDVYVNMPNDTYISQRDDETWNGLNNICDIAKLQDVGCSVCVATMVARIMKKNTSITTKNLYDWGVWEVKVDKDEHGNVTNRYPWATWGQNGNSELNFKFENPSIKGWSNAKEVIFDEITSNRPVVIWIQNAAIGGNHYVLGYGLLAGASRNNLQFNQIKVFNPDNRTVKKSKGTLQEFMNGCSLWRDFGGIRRIIPNKS